MPDIDLDRLMNEPIYAFDFQFMIGDVQDYLDFSENNIEWQYRSELQSIRRRAEAGDFEGTPHGYREHLETNAEHRFKVSLPLRIRYGALLALATAVEWSVTYLAQHLIEPVGTEPKRSMRLRSLTNVPVWDATTRSWILRRWCGLEIVLPTVPASKGATNIGTNCLKRFND